MKTGSQRDICTDTFRPALLTVAKKWKQPECPAIYSKVYISTFILSIEHDECACSSTHVTTTQIKSENIFITLNDSLISPPSQHPPPHSVKLKGDHYSGLNNYRWVLPVLEFNIHRVVQYILSCVFHST